MNYSELIEKCEELQNFADIMNDEMGETILTLIQLKSYVGYMSPSFEKAYYKEINRILKDLKNNTEVVREDVVVSHTEHRVSLKRKGE